MELLAGQEHLGELVLPDVQLHVDIPDQPCLGESVRVSVHGDLSLNGPWNFNVPWHLGVKNIYTQKLQTCFLHDF